MAATGDEEPAGSLIGLPDPRRVLEGSGRPYGPPRGVFDSMGSDRLDKRNRIAFPAPSRGLLTLRSAGRKVVTSGRHSRPGTGSGKSRLPAGSWGSWGRREGSYWLQFSTSDAGRSGDRQDFKD